MRVDPRWCRGLFKGTITLTEGPHCDPGQVCPEFATRVQTLGTVHFRVR